MLRVPLATSEKKTIFGRCVSSIRSTCPTHLPTVSKALVRCTKRMYRLWFCSRHFSWSFLWRISCRLSLCFSWRHTDSRTRNHPRGRVWYSSVWWVPWDFLKYSTARCLCGCYTMLCYLCSCTGGWRWCPWSRQEGILSGTGAFPAWSFLFFSGFPPVLWDRQESLEPGAEVYLGLLTGRFVEKLAKDFSPTLNDIILPCKQGSSRIWDRIKLKEGPYIQSSSPRRTS